MFWTIFSPAAHTEAAVKEAGVEVAAQTNFLIVVSMEKKVKTDIDSAVVTKPEVKIGCLQDLEVSVEVSKEAMTLMWMFHRTRRQQLGWIGC